MDTKFVKVQLDIHGDTLGSMYRIFVKDELFAERTWIWESQYLEEVLQISAPPGLYEVQLVPVESHSGGFFITNREVVHGPAQWIDNNILEIM